MRFIRWIHLYVTLAGFALMVLFAATGFILNHEDRFVGEAVVTEIQTTVPAELLAKADAQRLAGFMRERGARGRVDSFVADDEMIELALRAPGWRTDAYITLADGTAQIRHESRGLLGRLGDLHKGGHTGWGWQRLIDATAGVLLVSALTGVVLLVGMPRRRIAGLVVVLAGLAVVVALYVLVP